MEKKNLNRFKTTNSRIAEIEIDWPRKACRKAYRKGLDQLKKKEMFHLLHPPARPHRQKNRLKRK